MRHDQDKSCQIRPFFHKVRSYYDPTYPPDSLALAVSMKK